MDSRSFRKGGLSGDSGVAGGDGGVDSAGSAGSGSSAGAAGVDESVKPSDSRLSMLDAKAGLSGRSAGRSAGRLRRRRGVVPPKLYRIGEVVDYSGVSRQTIHNYTTMGLLRESRWTRGGHRLYDESVFNRLDEIVEMKASRKSLQDIREHFARVDGQ